MKRFFDVKFYYGKNNSQRVEVANVEAFSPTGALDKVMEANGFSPCAHFPLRNEQPMQRYDKDGTPTGLYKVWSAGLSIGGQRAWIYEQIGN